jgi:hypothetical protein
VFKTIGVLSECDPGFELGWEAGIRTPILRSRGRIKERSKDRAFENDTSSTQLDVELLGFFRTLHDESEAR